MVSYIEQQLPTIVVSVDIASKMASPQGEEADWVAALPSLHAHQHGRHSQSVSCFIRYMQTISSCLEAATR